MWSLRWLNNQSRRGVTLPDMKVMITDSTNPQAYPIAGFTWILAYVNQTDKAKGTTLAKCSVGDPRRLRSLPLDYAHSTTATTKAENEYFHEISGQAIRITDLSCFAFTASPRMVSQ
jgi:hypothetical protein